MMSLFGKVSTRSLKALILRSCIAGAIVGQGCAPVDEPEIRIVEMEAVEAARLADEIRETVSVNIVDDLELSLWASERLLADPVALHVDDRGRVFVTQTRRHRTQEFDIRDRPEWMIASIGLQTVEDRRDFLREELAPDRSEENTWLPDLNEDGSRDWRDLTALKETVYRIEDTSGDGLADISQVFHEGFNEEISDIAAGVLAYGDDVYLTVAPDLWRLRDTTGDGMADSKESIATGFGVHIGFSGHGLSGPTVGPDGRIYWAIGDYGLNTTGPDGREWVYPNQGVVVRSNPDGSDFEVVATGLRNTHDIDFDEYGNLISVDNDGDHAGEPERVVYLVDGSDSGWRINWQFGKYTDPDNNAYNVWMDEELHSPEGPAAYITPPVATFSRGPSGVVYNPGTALNERWRGHLFVSEFTGNPPTSGITALKLEPAGATFELVDEIEVLTGIQATSLAFGPDGAMYVADWIEGWGMNNEGRIWKLDDPDQAGSGIRQETQRLIEEGFSNRPSADVMELLFQPDMRVRQKAQFELAGRGAEGRELLLAAVSQEAHQLGRIHGLWGLAQMYRQGEPSGSLLMEFLGDGDPEVRAQAAKMLGDVRHAPAGEALIRLLSDTEARPRFFAAEALGRIGHGPAIEPILGMLESNDDEDAYLRHAGSLALARIGEVAPVAALSEHESKALRLAAVVALRRLRAPEIRRFLADEDEYVVTEAARAINDDFSIEEALPDLGRLLEDTAFTGEALIRRSINANLRLGLPEAAARVAAYASRADAPEAMRVEALAALGVWPAPSVLDRVDGRYRGRMERHPAIARDAIAPELEALLATGSGAVRAATAETVGRLEFTEAAPLLLAMVEGDASAIARAAALDALDRMDDERREAAVQRALTDAETPVRMRALQLLPATELPAETVAELLGEVMEAGTVPEQQSALEALGALRTPRAHEELGGLFDRLEADDVPGEIQLELLEAVEASGSAELQSRLASYNAVRAEEGMVAQYQETLAGGTWQRGRQIFLQHSGAQCIRCHAVGGQGGDVGPDLAGTGEQLTREEILQSLVDPSARITPGFGIVSLTLEDGSTVTGTLSEETDAYVVIETGGGERREVDRDEIAARRDAPSSMPGMAGILTRREIRDMVEYLAALDEGARIFGWSP